MKTKIESVDPITFEIIRHRLFQIVDEAIIALENVSGSPITNEGHDMMVSLYRSDGGLLVGGVGFLHHLTSAAQAVKHIIKNFRFFFRNLIFNLVTNRIFEFKFLNRK